MPKCVFCGAKATTKDHVFARRWFSNRAKNEWTVPSCEPCNNRYGRLEGEVLPFFAGFVDPKNEDARGLWHKARRSIDPAAGRDTRDARSRSASRAEFMSRLVKFGEFPAEHALPGSVANWSSGSTLGMLVAAKPLDDLVQKWVRGVHFKIEGRRLSYATTIDVFHALRTDDVLRDFDAHIERYEPRPGIVVERLVGRTGVEVGLLYRFRLWDHYEVCASLEENLAQPNAAA